MLQTTTITSKGQVTIPVYFRQQLGLKAGQKVEFKITDADKLFIEPIPDLLSLKGSLKSNKKYTKQAARKAILKDLVKRHSLKLKNGS